MSQLDTYLPSTNIQEGTAQELVPYLTMHPNTRFRLVELKQEEIPEGFALLSEERRKVALALLEEWLIEGGDADEETRREADRDLEEFKRNMNANRAMTGERLVPADLWTNILP